MRAELVGLDEDLIVVHVVCLHLEDLVRQAVGVLGDAADVLQHDDGGLVVPGGVDWHEASSSGRLAGVVITGGPADALDGGAPDDGVVGTVGHHLHEEEGILQLEVAVTNSVVLGGVEAELVGGGCDGERGADVGGYLRLCVLRDGASVDGYLAHECLPGGMHGGRRVEGGEDNALLLLEVAKRREGRQRLPKVVEEVNRHVWEIHGVAAVVLRAHHRLNEGTHIEDRALEVAAQVLDGPLVVGLGEVHQDGAVVSGPGFAVLRDGRRQAHVGGRDDALVRGEVPGGVAVVSRSKVQDVPYAGDGFLPGVPCPCVPGGLHGGSEDSEVQLRGVAFTQVVNVGECALVAGIVIAEGVEEGTEAPEEADLVAGNDRATAYKGVEPEVAALQDLPLLVVDCELRALARVNGADGSDAVRPFDVAEDKVVLGRAR